MSLAVCSLCAACVLGLALHELVLLYKIASRYLSA
jgi:hypothetical protein